MFFSLGTANRGLAIKQRIQVACRYNVAMTSSMIFSFKGSRAFRSSSQPSSQAGLTHATAQQGIDGILDGGMAFPLHRLTNITHHIQRKEKMVIHPPRIDSVRPKVAIDDDGGFNDTYVDSEIQSSPVPAYFRGSKFDRVPYWQKIGRWKDVSEEKWLSYSWGIANDIQGKIKLFKFLNEVVPDKIPFNEKFPHITTRDEFVQDVMEGIALAPMSIRIPPHIASVIDWNNPLDDVLCRQFIPMKSSFKKNHPKVSLDSLHEHEDSPVEGLVHRYTDKCLFLASSHCPLYCRYCTRSYAVGADTETVTKSSLKPQRKRWNAMLEYIERTPVINDVVISGGDSYSLMPPHLGFIGDRLLDIPHIRRFRVATKGLCVSPNRTLDPNDTWTDELIRLNKEARRRGKHIALHTHFNHTQEFSWVTREACQRLFEAGVIVRNQSVLLRGVNDDAETMKALIRELADNNILPYYVYAGDLVQGVEDLRTPLQTILDLEQQIRGSIAGFMTPQFVVDLPGGGGKRLAASYKSYDRDTGISTFVAPAVKGGNTVYEYFDPLHSLSEVERVRWEAEGRT